MEEQMSYGSKPVCGGCILAGGRGTGRTTRQMESAPKNAIFIWVNEFLERPKKLSRIIDRSDLEIVSPAWLESQKWRGRELSGIVIDHAARLSEGQQECLRQAVTRISSDQVISRPEPKHKSAKEGV